MTKKSGSRFVAMPALEYGKIKDEVRNLPQAVFNKLDREWPAHWPSEQGPKDLLRGLVRASEYTYRAGLFLIADDAGPSKRPEFAIALPPLARGLLDTLVTLVFLFDDFETNSRWYFRAGWRELAEYAERIGQLFPNDPLWTDWLKDFVVGLDGMRQDFGITKADAASAKSSMPYWPIPTQVPGVKGLSPDRKAFADYLITAYYRELSQDAHLSWPGLLRRAGPLLEKDGDFEHLRQSSFQVSLTLLMAILTEIDYEGRLGLKTRLAFLWGLLSQYHWLGEALFEQRYQARLR